MQLRTPPVQAVADAEKVSAFDMASYTSERITEIMKDFQQALKAADNFPKNDAPNNYHQFWVSFRKEGAALFGLTNYLLKETSVKKEKPPGAFSTDK